MSFKFKGVIFDLDGTLLDSMGIWHEIDRRFFEKRGIIMPDDYQEVVLNMHFPTAAAYTIERFGLNETADAIMQEWSRMALEMYAHEVQAKPGAIDFIRFLKASKIKMAIATSSQSDLYMPCLERLGIANDFSLMIQTQNIGCTKENPKVYQTILDAWQIFPTECIVFEDILMAIKTAKNLGIYTIGIYDASSKKDWTEINKIADKTIVDFTTLLEE